MHGENKLITYYDLNSTLDAYADSYREAAHDKFLMIEIQTYKDPQNVEGTIKPEILRLEHLYQSKWAKEFLESIGAEDKKLVNFSIDEYRKALEEDASFNYAVLANKGFYNQTKTHISKKWENRKTLDIAEGKLFAQTSGNLNKHKVQIEMIRKDVMEAKEAVKTSKAKLKALETVALITSNAYTSTSTYLRSVRRGIFTNDTLNDARITQAYRKARSDFADGTDELGNKIKLLEMKRIEFMKFQTTENRINWLLAEMKEDAKQFY
ncbi:unnamed protein product [Trichobilharzia szidati]|nr:unnamed protein product [Trichobilharzia szidati]